MLLCAGSAFFESLPDLDAWATMTQQEQDRSVHQVAGTVNDLMKALIGPEAAAVFTSEPASDVLPDKVDATHLSDAWVAEHFIV